MTPTPARRRSVINTISNIFHMPTNTATTGEPGSPAALWRRDTTPASTSAAEAGSSNELERTRSASQQAQRESEMSATAQDLLFQYQLTLPDPKRLGPESFHAGGVAANRAISARIYAALQRHNIISTASNDAKIYTDRISRQLPSQLPMLSPAELHRMVGMLFFWEEEQVRFNIIEAAIQTEKKRYADQELSDVDPPTASNQQVPMIMTTSPESKPVTSEGVTPLQSPAEHQQQSQVVFGAQQMSNSYARQALLERHKLALAHLENERRSLPSRREDLAQGAESMSEAVNGRSQLLARSLAAKPPPYGDFQSSVPVMSSPSREDLTFIGTSRTDLEAQRQRQQRQTQDQEDGEEQQEVEASTTLNQQASDNPATVSLPVRPGSQSKKE